MSQNIRAGRGAGGALAALLAVMLVSPAWAYDCRLNGGIFPRSHPGTERGTEIPASVPPEPFVVALCAGASSPYCSPTLSLRGEDIGLIEVDRRPLLGNGSLDTEGVARWEIVRFTPAAPLLLGEVYDLTIYVQHPTVPGFRLVDSFEVAEDDGSSPALPVITALEFWQREGWTQPLREAKFRLETLTGVLVADVGEPDEDPWQNIDLMFSGADAEGSSFRLGTSDCGSSLRQADLGLQTRVRFGQLDALGRFSGWTPFYEVSYPEVETDEWIPGEVVALEATPDEGSSPPSDQPSSHDAPSLLDGATSSSGCSLSASGSDTRAASWLFALVAVYASRRLSSARSGSTSSRSRRASVSGEPG